MKSNIPDVSNPPPAPLLGGAVRWRVFLARKSSSSLRALPLVDAAPLGLSALGPSSDICCSKLNEKHAFIVGVNPLQSKKTNNRIIGWIRKRM
jgi:hypothetical protein